MMEIYEYAIEETVTIKRGLMSTTAALLWWCTEKEVLGIATASAGAMLAMVMTRWHPLFHVQDIS